MYLSTQCIHNTHINISYKFIHVYNVHGSMVVVTYYKNIVKIINYLFKMYLNVLFLNFIRYVFTIVAFKFILFQNNKNDTYPYSYIILLSKTYHIINLFFQ